MNDSYWQKQGDEPLFSELEWNKPERRDHAGKILILGGHLHALGAPAEAFEAIKGVSPGRVELALPSATKRLLGNTLPEANFLPSTQSGELSIEAKNELFALVHAADTALLVGDTGRNSQTTQLLEELINNIIGQCIITRDSLDVLTEQSNLLLGQQNITIVASFAQLQKITQKSGEEIPLTYKMSLEQIVRYLHNFSEKHPASIASLHNGQLIVASGGRVSTTKLLFDEKTDQKWRTAFSSIASCYQTWYPNKPFESLTHTAHLLANII